MAVSSSGRKRISADRIVEDHTASGGQRSDKSQRFDRGLRARIRRAAEPGKEADFAGLKSRASSAAKTVLRSGGRKSARGIAMPAAPTVLASRLAWQDGQPRKLANLHSPIAISVGIQPGTQRHVLRDAACYRSVQFNLPGVQTCLGSRNSSGAMPAWPQRLRNTLPESFAFFRSHPLPIGPSFGFSNALGGLAGRRIR